jgi:hypothetical protein
VSITTMQGLKNVSLKVREELITQSRYPIKDARPPTRPPGIHHSTSRMHFVQPGQKRTIFFLFGMVLNIGPILGRLMAPLINDVFNEV